MRWSDVVVGKVYRHASGNVYRITRIGHEEAESYRLWPKWNIDVPNCVTLWFPDKLTELSPEEAAIYLMQG